MQRIPELQQRPQSPLFFHLADVDAEALQPRPQGRRRMPRAIDAEIQRATGRETLRQGPQRPRGLRNITQHAVTGDQIKIAADFFRQLCIREIGDEKRDRASDLRHAFEFPRHRDRARTEIHRDDFRLRQLAPQHQRLHARAAAGDEHAPRRPAAGPADALHPLERRHRAAAPEQRREIVSRIREALVDLLDAFGGGQAGSVPISAAAGQLRVTANLRWPYFSAAYAANCSAMRAVFSSPAWK